MKTPALRFADGSDDTIEGLLVPFNSPFPENRDTYGTIFSNRTNFQLDWYGDRPLLYYHGQDPDLAAERIGTIRSLEVIPDLGVWMRAQVDKHNQYYSAIKALVGEDKLGLSSGSIDYLVEINSRSGHVDQWPIAEGSLTPTSANPYAVIAGHSFRAASGTLDTKLAEQLTDEAEIVSAAALADPERVTAVRAKMTAKERDALDDSDFAYIDADGGRHLPINDADHVKAALARFDQTEFESDAAKEKARKKILAAAKKFGVEVSDDDTAARSAAIRAAETSLTERSFEDIRDDISCQLNPSNPFGYVSTCWTYIVATYPDHVIVCRCEEGDDDSYWSIPYTLDESMEPVLDTANAEQVQQAFVPAAARGAAVPLTMDAQRLTLEAATLTARTKDLGERRYREGRVLSAANRQTLQKAHEAMGDAHVALGRLLESTDRIAEDAARANDPVTWEGQELELELLSIYADCI